MLTKKLTQCYHFLEKFVQHCTSCNIQGNQHFGGHKTLGKCKADCLKKFDTRYGYGPCTSIDYFRGENGEERQCYYNYGGETTYDSRNYFDGYILKTLLGKN